MSDTSDDMELAFGSLWCEKHQQHPEDCGCIYDEEE